MKISKLAGLVCGTAFVLGTGVAHAQIAISAVTTTVDFTGFTAAGFVSTTPAAGQLSSQDWSVSGFSDGDLNFGGNQANAATDYTRGASTGNVTTSGIYAFSNGGNVFLGVQPGTGDFAPGNFTARFKNTLTRPLLKLGVSYRILVRNDTARSNSLNFAWSIDGVNFTAVGALDFASPTDAATTPAWVSTNRTATLTTNIATNGILYFRWTGDDVSGTGARDEMGIDDISIVVQTACGDGVAEGSEQCDDGNASNTDNCLTTCQQATCGDGFIRSGGGEQCDPGVENSVCCSNACTKQTGVVCPGGMCNNGACVPTGGTGGGAGNGGHGGNVSEGGEGGDAAGQGGDTAGGEGGVPNNPGGRTGRGGRGGRTGTTGGAPNGGVPAAGRAGGGMAGATAGAPAAGSGGRGGSAGGEEVAGTSAGGKGGTGGTGITAGKGGTGGTGTKPPASGNSDDSGGCGCAVPRGSNHGTAALALAGALAAFLRRRRGSRNG